MVINWTLFDAKVIITIVLDRYNDAMPKRAFQIMEYYKDGKHTMVCMYVLVLKCLYNLYRISS